MTEPELTEAAIPTGVAASKRCNICHQEKPLEDFHKRSASRDGLQGKCKRCANGAAREYNQEYSEKRRDTWRRYRRSAYLKQTYGITIEQYWELYRQQDERCAICRVHGDDAGQHTVQQLPLHIDHCHASGKVRGLLCRYCNMGLGSFKDNRGALVAALDYLERHQ